jgi:acetylornithine/succinyldiaminopimelate/putrescine aminotransferase
MLTTNEIAKALSVGSHGTTYGGNPLATSVALAVLGQINQPAFLARVREASARMMANLEQLATDYPQLFTRPRGKGLLLGLPVADGYKGRSKDYTKVAEKCGLMLLIAGPDVVRLAPALVVSDEQIAEADRIMRKSAEEFLAAQ